MSEIKYYIYRDGKAIGLLQEEDHFLAILQDKFATSMLVGKLLIHKKEAGESWTHAIPILSESFEIKAMQGNNVLVWTEVWTTSYRISAESKNVVIFEDVLLSLKPTHYDDKRSIQA